MDGMLSFFEQETFTFGRFLPNFLLPSPLEYVSGIDSFVICSSARNIECYKWVWILYEVISNDLKLRLQHEVISRNLKLRTFSMK